MLKNVKDSTDRHWNMIFFFRETDRQDGKKDNLDALTSSPFVRNNHLPSQGRRKTPDREGDGTEEGLWRAGTWQKNKIKLKKIKKA